MMSLALSFAMAKAGRAQKADDGVPPAVRQNGVEKDHSARTGANPVAGARTTCTDSPQDGARDDGGA